MDSTRSWVVAAACSWINVFTFALVRSSAVVYVALLRAFPGTRERASWPANLAVVCYFLTGPIAGVLARYVPIWKLSMVGCLGSSLAISACFFAPSMAFLDVFLGFIHGTSIGLLSLFSIVVNQHFLRYRAVASGIANAGFTVGGLLFPPAMKALEEKYGIHGTFLIFGAIILNSMAGALLQRTPPPAQQDEDKKGASNHDADGRSVIPKRQDESLRSDKRSDFSQILDDTSTCGCNGTRDQCCQMTRLFPSEVRDISCDMKEQAMDASSADDFSCGKKDDNISEEKCSLSDPVGKNEVQFRPLSNRLTRPNREHFLSFLLLPEYYLTTFSFTIIHFNMTTYNTVVVDFGVDRGISAWSGVYLISVYAVSDLIARLGSGWITDKKYLRKSTMMGSHLALWGASLCLVPLCSSYPSLVAMSVLFGWCNGSTIILVVVIFMELVGLDKVGVCFGCANAVAGLAGLARPLLIGFFRDTRGDYAGLFSVIGGTTMFVSLLWLFYRVREGCILLRKGTNSSKTCSKLKDCASTS
nr:monocarboxylate transporter 5-like [Rhipicephalus microplus]